MAVLQREHQQRKTAFTSQYEKKSKVTLRSEGVRLPVFQHEVCKKPDKNSFVKKRINFHQAVQRFSFLRFSSLFIHSECSFFLAVNRRGFVFLGSAPYKNHFRILMSYVCSNKCLVLCANMPGRTDKKQRRSFIKGWLYSMHIFLVCDSSQKLIGNRKNLRVTQRLTSKDLHVSSGFGW